MLIFTKAHVAAYTKKDGTTVVAHDRRPLYASRKVLNAAELHDWAIGSGFKHVVPPDKMHVTVAYSRAPVHHASVNPDAGTLLAAPVRIGLLGDENAHVLHVDHPRLHSRFAQIMNLGASWDHDGGAYSPHVTISYKPQDGDLTGVEPFNGVLHLGPEVTEDLKPGWGTSLVTKSMDAAALFMKAHVGPYMRGGKMVNISGYQGRNAQAAPSPGQMALFPSADPGPNPFRGKDPVADTPDLFTGKTPREHDASRPPPNGGKFGTIYHGTARPFDSFAPEKMGKMGGGYNHQGLAVYLTDDPHGMGRFFARAAAGKVAAKDKSLSAEESDRMADSDGVVMRVKLSPDARILDMRDGDAPADVRALFDKSVGDKDAYTKLREAVIAHGYDGLAFHEPNRPEGWETKADATTVVVYDAGKAKVIDHQDANDYRKKKPQPPPVAAKPHPLERSAARLAENRERLAEAKAGGDASSVTFLEDYIIPGNEESHAKLEAAFAAHAKTGDGTELSQADGKRHAILLPDASNPGKYRYQMFDDRGFSGHSTHDTPEEAVADAAKAGYHVHSPGILDKLAGAEEWSHGMAINAIMQAHNSGQIDWRTATDRMNALHDEREAKKAAASPAPAPADEAHKMEAMRTARESTVQKFGQESGKAAEEHYRSRYMAELERLRGKAAPAPAALSVAGKRRVRADHVNGEAAHTLVKLSDGTEHRMNRLNSAESMGLPGWHHDGHGYLADTEDQAAAELARKQTSAPAAAAAPPEHPAPVPRSMLQAVPEDRRAEWLDLHRRQHEMHHYDLGLVREDLGKARGKLNRAQTAMREAEAGAKSLRGHDLPGSEARAREADAAAARSRAEFDKHSAEVGRLKGVHQTIYEKVAKLGRDKDKILPLSGEPNIDWAAQRQRTSEEQAEHEKAMLGMYRRHYKDLAGRPMRKSWDWLGTTPLHGQIVLFLPR